MNEKPLKKAPRRVMKVYTSSPDLSTLESTEILYSGECKECGAIQFEVEFVRECDQCHLQTREHEDYIEEFWERKPLHPTANQLIFQIKVKLKELQRVKKLCKEKGL